jgi:hypothetical protein
MYVWDIVLCNPMFGLFLDSEEVGDIFLQNAVWLSTNYMALYIRR